MKKSGRTAVAETRDMLRHDNDPKHTSKMTRATLMKRNIHQLCDVIMDEWENLVKMLVIKRVKAFKEHNGGRIQ